MSSPRACANQMALFDGLTHDDQTVHEDTDAVVADEREPVLTLVGDEPCDEAHPPLFDSANEAQQALRDHLVTWLARGAVQQAMKGLTT